MNPLLRSSTPKCPFFAVALLAATGCSFFLFGCGILKKPDLSRANGIARLRKPQHPLVVIPGFLGSKLRDPKTGKVLWGTMGNILSHDQSYRLACPIVPDGPDAGEANLEAFAIYDSLWGVEYYRKSLRILWQAGGYQLGDIQHPRPGDNAFVFVYDWRKDIVDSAQRLAGALEKLKRSLGDPDIKFDLLAHSQGGLLARYYAKYGSADVLGGESPSRPTGDGAKNLNKVILLGTPNQGTLEALKILHQGVKKVFRPMPPAVTFTMPALYEMLPPSGTTNFANLDGKPVPIDLYDPDSWVREKLSIFSDEQQEAIYRQVQKGGASPSYLETRNTKSREFLARALARAQRFQAALAAPAPLGQEVAFYAFGSDCIPTLKTAVVMEEKGGRRIYFEPGRYRRDQVADRMAKVLFGPGDGTVLMESLLDLPEIYGGAAPPSREAAVNLNSAFFVCESHGLLPNDPIFQNNLFYLLLYGSDPISGHAPALAERAGS
ncbi:MAG: hypothetical protein DMH00_05155 [Acidobacteria bacterium]|nr:MAG: hypothetical protein DMH00_05155 [Acidobacteriota bacterium]